MRRFRAELEIDEPNRIMGDPEINETHFAYAAYLMLLGSGLAISFYLQDPERYNVMLRQIPNAIATGFGLK